MKRYGFRIGDVGVEFVSRDERTKAIGIFTSGSTARISDSGIRFREDKGAFATYERDDKEVQVNCAVCSGIFGIEAAPQRGYPQEQSWSTDKWTTTEGHICDACFESKRKAKELFDAKKIVSASA